MGCCISSTACEAETTSESSEEALNINTASLEDLLELPGIGKARAEAILQRRQKSRFKSFDDLLSVPGIGPSVVAQLNGQISFGPSSVAPPVKPLRQEGHDVLFFPDDKAGTGLKKMLEILGGAKSKIHAAIFAIAHSDLASALIAARKRGVEVKIITDDVQAKGDASQVPQLKAAGIEVCMDDSEKFHMHHKFVVIDDCILLNGSLNWTYAGLKKANENVVISRSPGLCKVFTDEFKRILTAFASGSVATAPAGRFHENVAVLFFPEPSGANVTLLRQELQRARQSIEIAVFTLTLDTLADVLLEKHKAGVKVRVITDNRQAEVPGADAKRLLQAGVAVRTDKSWYAMHHKFAIVDSTTVINGSFNWTMQATKGNQENTLILRHAGALAKRFTEVYERLWAMFA